jgi:hypothetical protein
LQVIFNQLIKIDLTSKSYLYSMNSRRKFLQSGVALAGLNLLPSVNLFAGPSSPQIKKPADFKLRFAVASDGHYGQPGTDGDKFYSDLVKWLTKEHQDNHLDMVIINGDLVHDRPDLLPKIKQTYLDKLPVPCYTVPGNHDHVDAAMWKAVFGYEDNHVVDKGDVGICTGQHNRQAREIHLSGCGFSEKIAG